MDSGGGLGECRGSNTGNRRRNAEQGVWAHRELYSIDGVSARKTAETAAVSGYGVRSARYVVENVMNRETSRIDWAVNRTVCASTRSTPGMYAIISAGI